MRTKRGSVWAGAIVSGVAVLTVLLRPAPAYASDESRLLSLTNQVRAASGLPALTIDAQLTSVAQRWAATLADRGVISHNSALTNQVTGWKVVGENVGVGGTVDAIHAGWMASPTHHQNIVDPAYTKVGFGIVRPDARVFVVQVFMRPSSPAASPPPAAAVSSANASAPSPVAAKPAATGSPVAPATAPLAPPVTTAPAVEPSPWLVHSLDRIRSLGPAEVK